VPACALSAGALDVVEVVLDAAPNLTFFSTKPLASALLAGALADVSLLIAPAACRQPVALAMLVVELADACAFGVVGLCAASDPHSATAVLSVTAHCHRCVFFMTSLLLVRVRIGRARPGTSPTVRTRPGF